MRPSLYNIGHSGLTAALAVTIWVTLQWGGAASAAHPALPLQLEVSINGRKIGMIGSFVSTGEQRLASTADELASLGIRTPAGTAARPPIELDELAKVSYQYDDRLQTIDITVPDELLMPREIGPTIAGRTTLSDNSMVGAIANYNLVGSIYDDASSNFSNVGTALKRSPQTVSLDTRLFGPWGTLSNSGFIGRGIDSNELAVRLETSWTVSDPETMRTFRFGDFVASGLAWNRPLRLAGLQVRRDFALRPDLVTSPMPILKGSAAVPSTVDVFINNVKTYSKDVEAGPFSVANLPTISGAGVATVVVRDAAGHETTQNSSFYQTATLLRKGIYDYAIESGVARSRFGSASFEYDEHPVATSSLRYGIHDTITLEGHVEGGMGLVNGGAGVSFNAFNLSLISAAASLSTVGDDQGAQGYLGLQTRIGGVSVNISSQRTLGSYKDLAAIIGTSLAERATGVPLPALDTYDPPKAQDAVTFAFELPAIAGQMSLSGINRLGGSGRSQIVTGSYSRPLTSYASFYVGGFHELIRNDTGLFAGVSIPLGEFGQGQIGLSRNADQAGVSGTYSKTAGQEPGSLGWRVSDSEGVVANRSAFVTYQGQWSRTEAGVDHAAKGTRARTTIDGAIVASKDGTYLTNRVEEGFAVIDVGAPGVDVLLENRRIATTDRDGKALVPGLRPYQRNKIRIDPTMLPVDVAAPVVELEASPRGPTGVTVDLRTETMTDSAVVVFKQPDNSVMPAGTQGILQQGSQAFVIGYDGRAFIERLSQSNRVTIDRDGAPCEVEFAFHRRPGRQQVIEAPKCK